MLAGIKIGKKKQKRPAQEGGPLELPLAKKTTNRSAAQELKRALAKTGIVSSETTQSDQNLLQRIERIAKREEANNISEPMVVLTRAAVASDRPIFQKGKKHSFSHLSTVLTLCASILLIKFLLRCRGLSKRNSQRKN